jgi:hypothetical protein
VTALYEAVPGQGLATGELLSASAGWLNYAIGWLSIQLWPKTRTFLAQS